MRTHFAALGAVILTLSATGALADGMPVQDEPPAATPCCSANWTGFYGAASVGYGAAVTDVDYGYNADDLGEIATSRSVDGDGVIGAVGIGYDHLLRDRFLIGLFGEYAFGNLDDSASLPGDDTIRLSYDDTWSVGARFGLVHCCTLFYATVGYTSTEVEMSTLVHDESDRVSGWFVGGGLEHYLHHNFFIRAEYRFSQYEDAGTYVVFPCGACGTGYEDIDRDHEIHSVRLGLVYKFGHREPEPAPLK